MLARHFYEKNMGMKSNMIDWLYKMMFIPVITDSVQIWKPKMKKATSVNRLVRMQRITCGNSGSNENHTNTNIREEFLWYSQIWKRPLTKYLETF